MSEAIDRGGLGADHDGASPMSGAPSGYALCDHPSAALLDEVFRLRVRAWRARQGLFPSDIESWSDAFDADAKHFVILCEGAPVAAARITIHHHPCDGPDGELYAAVPLNVASPPIGFISRLVVCPAHAGRGLSTRLDVVRLANARAEGCRSMLASTNAEDARWRQLEVLGFRRLYVADKGVAGPLERLLKPVVFVKAPV